MSGQQRSEDELHEHLGRLRDGSTDLKDWDVVCEGLAELMAFRRQQTAVQQEDAQQLCRQCSTPRNAHCDLDEPGLDHPASCCLHHHEFKPQRLTLKEDAKRGLKLLENMVGEHSEGHDCQTCIALRTITSAENRELVRAFLAAVTQEAE